jgi:cytochrome c-type biogenesis protein CcmF
VRPWTLAAWMFLTAGIAMGSYWAYYELGWGGWWFWDPVENASFMPWLAGTALLHSALVMEKREALKVWTILLAILAFSLSLLGTFLVRSGVLTSVHAFATDPTRGVVILGILVFFIGGALFLFALRGSSLSNGGMFHPISREGGLVLNNLLLTTATATVFVGTLYPLAVEAVTGEKISVGAPYFNATFGPLMVPLLLVVPFGPLMAWKRGDIVGAAQRLYAAVGVALIAGLAVIWFATGAPILAAIGIAIGTFVLVGAFADIWQKSGLPKSGLKNAGARLAGLPRSNWGTALAHAGLGITTLGVVAVTAFQQESVLRMTPGDETEMAGYSVRLDTIAPRQGPNYTEDVATFVVSENGREVASIAPAKRVYTARQMPTTEAGIETKGFSQLYIALGDRDEAGDGIVVRLWWKPNVTLIWFGTIAMVIGAMFSLSDRRLRVGAPSPSRKRRQTVAAAE